MIEETNLPDASPAIEGTDAVSRMGILYLNQDEHGGVELSPKAQYDLLEFLYARRYALYRTSHISLGADDTPEWIQSGSSSATRIVDTHQSTHESMKAAPRRLEGSIVYLADGRQIRAEVERFYDQGHIQFESRQITVERLPRPYDGLGYGELVIIKRRGKMPLGAVLHPREYENHTANVPTADGEIIAKYDQATKEWHEIEEGRTR